MKWEIIFGIVALFILTILTEATWTPYEDIDMWCMYEEFNVTNITICGNLSMGDTCGEGCVKRFMIIPNQSGYIYFWSSGLPFYFNNNVTINGTITVNGTTIINGSVTVTGNVNMTKHNITEVGWMSIDNLVNNSGGNKILIHSNINMTKYNITGISWATGGIANFTTYFGELNGSWNDSIFYILNSTAWSNFINNSGRAGSFNINTTGNGTFGSLTSGNVNTGYLNVTNDSSLQNVTLDTVKKAGVNTHYYIDDNGALIVHLET